MAFIPKSKGYTTIEDIGIYLGIDAQEDWDDFIISIEKLIEQETGRVFVADSVAGIRYFHGQGSPFLRIDDCIEVTKVETGDTYGDSFTEIEEDGYILVPREDTPIKGIYLKDNYWNKGIGNHRITAKWGYSEDVPGDIKLATTILTAGIVKNNIKSKGDKVSERIGDYTVSYSQEKGLNDFNKAKAILDSYKLFLL